MGYKTQYKFVMLKSKRKMKQPYHWVCYAPNGQIKFHAEKYLAKRSMVNVIQKHISDLRPGIARLVDDTGEGHKVYERD